MQCSTLLEAPQNQTDVLRFTVLGDSAAFGIGDVDSQGVTRGWAHYLAGAIGEKCEYVNLSRPGAKSSEVVAVQLPRAVESKPHLSAVIVGGNDMLRNGFNPTSLCENLRRACHELLSIGSTVLMVELHDPAEILRVPRLLKRVIRKRVSSVNQVYRKVAEELDIVLIKTRSIPGVHNVANWHIDRMHPGRRGHQLLAAEIVRNLNQRGFDLSEPKADGADEPSQREKIIWLIKCGTPWFLKRSVDLLPVALFLMLVESIKVIAEVVQPKRGEQKSSLPASFKSY